MNIPNGRRMNYGVPYKGSKNQLAESLFVPRYQLELYRRMRGNGKGCQLTLFGEEYRADGSIIFTNNTGAQRATV